MNFYQLNMDVEGEGLEEKNKTYGLLTAIAMIVGTVVGSGIYFKADDILSFTGGNVTLGVLVILLGAVNIVFGSLTLAQLALRTTTSGGLAGYAEIYYNQTFATVIGLFQSFIYIPVITTVVTWVASSYTLSLLKPDASFEVEIILTIVYLFIIAIMNYYSKQLAGFFQSLSTFIKVIPLIIIMIMGLIWHQP
ncbi:amino acid permease, partial [Globicatella sulfidifaciens]